MLTYLGLPVNQTINFDTEFNTRDISKPSNDVLNILDVENTQTLNSINLYGNSVITGNYKSVGGSTTNYSRSYPLLNLGVEGFTAINSVANASVPIPSVLKIPFYNLLRGDGKGFSLDLGQYPVRLKVFQDAANAATSRFTISTSGLGGIVVPRQSIGVDVNGTSVSSIQNSTTLTRGNRTVADKTFTAKYLGAVLETNNGNTQMAIYSSTGVLLGKTLIKSGSVVGRQLFTLENNVSIVSGQAYFIMINSTVNNSIRKAISTQGYAGVTKSQPFDTNPINTTYSTFTDSLCLWVENESNSGTTTENNSLNIWANGMVSIGNTLDAATYANLNAAGDLELNPMSLLVQNDLMIGTNGIKDTTLARLHVKATQAEFNANRYMAFFSAGDGINAGAITRKGEYVVATAGGGFICLDAINGAYYRIFVSNGTIQIQPFT